jgi:hypothetical protein
MNVEQEKYLEVGHSCTGSIESLMFGKPCFKINGKAFICFFDDCMVFKLSGETHSEALSLDGACLFDPSGKGRAMKEWVQLPFDYHEMWDEFGKASMKFVGSLK